MNTELKIKEQRTLDLSGLGEAFAFIIKEIEGIKTSVSLLHEKSEFKQLYKISEAAKVFNCSDQHVRNMIADGKLGKVNISGSPRITREEIERFIQENSVKELEQKVKLSISKAS